VKLSDYKGKVVLLNFWATWCGPCKVEIPWFMDFQKAYKDRDFAVVGVSMDEDGWDAVKPYVEQKKMNYRVVLGNDQVSQLFGNVDSLPTTIVIDREGRIASMHIGLVAKATYQKEIEKLLEAPKDAPKTGAERTAGSEFALLHSN
jgi:thiol-disulfide isomerase/thioredoxin